MSFLLLGAAALVLTAVRLIAFDLSAVLVIVLTLFLNTLFLFLWADEARKGRVRKVELPLPVAAARTYPMVSFVVPVCNEEQTVAAGVDRLFGCAAEYRGSSEIIVVDDGSLDGTFEAAWAAVDSKQKELVTVRGKVAKHLASLGRGEAVRTGAARAMGEYVAVVDAEAVCDPAELSRLVDSMGASGAVDSGFGSVRVYRADRLRQLLEKGGKSGSAVL